MGPNGQALHAAGKKHLTGYPRRDIRNTMPHNPNSKLGERIRKAFRKSGMSMKQLSDRSGIGYAAIHGFCTGTRDMHLGSASKVCDVLGLTLVSIKRRKGR